MFANLGSITKVLVESGKRFISFGKSVASESDGTGSSSRVVALAVTFTLMGTMITYLIMTHTLPTADQFYGIAAVLAAGTSAYIGNQFRKHDGGSSGPNPPQGGQ